MPGDWNMWVESTRRSKILKVLLIPHYYYPLSLDALCGSWKDHDYDGHCRGSDSKFLSLRMTDNGSLLSSLPILLLCTFYDEFSAHRSFPADVGPLSEADGNFICQCDPLSISLPFLFPLSFSLSVEKRQRVCSVFCSQPRTDAYVLSHKFSFARK